MEILGDSFELVSEAKHVIRTVWACESCYKELCEYLKVGELECFSDSPLVGVTKCYACDTKENVRYHICGQEV